MCLEFSVVGLYEIGKNLHYDILFFYDSVIKKQSHQMILIALFVNNRSF